MGNTFFHVIIVLGFYLFIIDKGALKVTPSPADGALGNNPRRHLFIKSSIKRVDYAYIHLKRHIKICLYIYSAYLQALRCLVSFENEHDTFHHNYTPINFGQLF